MLNIEKDFKQKRFGTKILRNINKFKKMISLFENDAKIRMCRFKANIYIKN